jgi:2-phospho-L-lactate/phosphoenolpyruvate guanylyltransferase
MKSLDSAKQPLQDDYTPGERRALTEAMFSDVLIALRRTASLDETLVVSVDRGARPIAAGYGALVRPDDDRGHDHAAIAGIGEALKRGPIARCWCRVTARCSILLSWMSYSPARRPRDPC